MKLINTDGMAFIGPGSEWFWTALTGVVLAITFFAIYRQLGIARSVSAYEQVAAFDREWRSERMIRHELGVLVALRDGVDREDVPSAAAYAIAGFWEEIGGLARRRHLDPKLLSDAGSGEDCIGWWLVLAAHTQKRRAAGAGAPLYENFEWLAGVMADLNRRAGGQLYNEPYLAANLEPTIAQLRDALEVEEALRTVIVASPKSLPVAPPARPAMAEG